jgi:hypothetical protein
MNRSVAMYGLIAVGFVCFALPAPAHSAEDPKLDVRMSASGNRFTYTVTNLGSKSVTAHVLKTFFQQNRREQLQMWDSVLADESPIEPEAQVSGGIGRFDGGPYPVRVEVVAGIWADGETFGQSVSVKQLLDAREEQASAFEHVAKLLQRGLDENWTRDQYQHALDGMPESLAVYGAGSTLKNNPLPIDQPKLLRHLVISMWDRFTGTYERIRRATPVSTAATNP